MKMRRSGELCQRAARGSGPPSAREEHEQRSILSSTIYFACSSTDRTFNKHFRLVYLILQRNYFQVSQENFFLGSLTETTGDAWICGLFKKLEHRPGPQNRVTYNASQTFTLGAGVPGLIQVPLHPLLSFPNGAYPGPKALHNKHSSPCFPTVYSCACLVPHTCHTPNRTLHSPQAPSLAGCPQLSKWYHHPHRLLGPTIWPHLWSLWPSLFQIQCIY